MTEQEVLQRQETNGQKEFYLILMGQFYHAYGNGAFALARASGYRVMRKERRKGEVLVTGFPASCLERVKSRISENHGMLREVDEKTFIFYGIDGTPDMQMVIDSQTRNQNAERPQEQKVDEHDIILQIRRFNLSVSTPMDAMNLISRLQQQLERVGEDIIV